MESKALIKNPDGSWKIAAIPAVASLVIPGLGQGINGQWPRGVKLFGVWAVAAVLGKTFVGSIPGIGWIIGGIVAVCHLYGAADALLEGRFAGQDTDDVARKKLELDE